MVEIFYSTIGYIMYYNAKYKANKALLRGQREKEKADARIRRQIKRYGWYAGKSYPWSVLARCKCGNRHPWIHGFPSGQPYNEIVEPDSKYRVVCHRCFRHTDKGTYTQVVVEWNSRMVSSCQQIVDELRLSGIR